MNDDRRVSREDFRKDPAKYLRLAKEGAVSVVADDGTVRMTICAPSAGGSRGAELIALERDRQRVQWGDAHDDKHDEGELAMVAAAIAAHGSNLTVTNRGREFDPWGLTGRHGGSVRGLQIAGALIAAEIDRRLRAGEPEPYGETLAHRAELQHELATQESDHLLVNRRALQALLHDAQGASEAPSSFALAELQYELAAQGGDHLLVNRRDLATVLHAMEGL